MSHRRLIFRAHAMRRMFQRGIRVAEIRRAIEQGDIIEEYPDDVPYPSRLLLSWTDLRPIHLVAADNPASDETIVITVYEPSPDWWEPGFRRRKPT